MNKDDLIREYRQNGASWPAIVGVYCLLVSGLFFSASSML